MSAPKSREKTDYCVFEYLCRDGGNWKTWGEVLLSGCLPVGTRQKIESCFETDGLFVAEQIDIASLCPAHFERYGGPTELDHAYHEFNDLRVATKEDVATMVAVESVSSFLSRVCGQKGKWNVLRSPNAWI